MRLPSALIAAAYALLATGPSIGAQQVGPPVRPLGPIIATAAEPARGVVSVRTLSNGRVMINDRGSSRLLLFDSTLQSFVTVADTTGETSKAYGDFSSTLFPFTGDSSLFSDRRSQAFLVIDPLGKISRIMAMPTPSGGNTMVVNGTTVTLSSALPIGANFAYDMAGHFVFPTEAPIYMLYVPDGFIGDTVVRGADSTAILRLAIGTRRLDTIAKLQAPIHRQLITRRAAGGGSGRAMASSIPSGDDWTMMPDGTLAIVRARDYHIDWVHPDGTMTSTPKIAHQWVRLTDDIKQAMIDSARTADSVNNAKARAAWESDSAAGRGAFSPANLAAAAGRGRGNAGPPTLNLAPGVGDIQLSDIPDYRPPFVPSGSGSGMNLVRPDADGNVWIRVSAATPDGGPVFEVINRQGVLIDRVQLPGGVNLVGFGPGVVYLTSRVGTTTQFARARIH